MVGDGLERWTVLDQTCAAEHAWLTAHAVCDGAVVELGTWMGASTAALAEGLPPGRHLHTFDRFQFHDHAEFVTANSDLTYVEGASFRAMVDERLAPYGDAIRVHEGDLRNATWDEPIGLLVQDAAKSWDTWCSIVATFYPHVIGLVVEEDFGHTDEPWLHVHHWRWRRHLTPVGPIEGSTSYVFRVRRPLTPELLAWDPREGMSARDLDRVERWALARGAPPAAIAWLREYVPVPTTSRPLRKARRQAASSLRRWSSEPITTYRLDTDAVAEELPRLFATMVDEVTAVESSNDGWATYTTTHAIADGRKRTYRSIEIRNGGRSWLYVGSR